MSTTMQFDLFRPSILDPVDDGVEIRARAADRGLTRARPAQRPVAVPSATVGGDQHAHVPARGPEGGPTLDHLVVGVWEDLIAHRTVACLACGAAMAPRYGAGHAPVGGRCKGCGTTIY
jgi:hypothetical protein